MNKREMADRLAVGGLDKAAARDAVDGVFEAIGEALANGEDVRIAAFGTFSVKSRPARTGRNPRTGEPVSISASRSPSFKAGKTLGEALANGEDVRIAAFGTFSVKSRPARTGRNPRTGEPVSISASRSPSFKAGKTLKDSLNADQKT